MVPNKINPQQTRKIPRIAIPRTALMIKLLDNKLEESPSEWPSTSEQSSEMLELSSAGGARDEQGG
jgi:hypothetical protein